MKKDEGGPMSRIRLVLPVDVHRAVVVEDNPDAGLDKDYAPGVNDAFEEALIAGDHFYVYAVDESGAVVNSICGMAGYGGPHAAARAAMRDYFGIALRAHGRQNAH
jgi:hypothetical protein